MSRISLLIDSPLRDLAIAFRGLSSEVRKQVNQQTRKHAQPIWADETNARVMSTQQARLASSARVGVTNRNVFMRAGSTGKLGETTLTRLAYAIEFGADPNKKITSKTAKGKTYTRRLGRAFPLPRSRGYVAYPASKTAIPRLARLWIQTTIRTIHETVEKVK